MSHTARIDLDATGAASVELDGTDVSRAVTSVHVHAEHGERPHVTLGLALHDISTLAETRILVPEDTAAALVALGWTPPEDVGQGIDVTHPALREAVLAALRHAARARAPWLTELLRRHARIEGLPMPTYLDPR
ncbi:hypothetical protein [Streptomyces sp. NPDC053541]|uniref:hypothetical protein n=1 Tax=Streptomyces sp. NPDC053541 TaxID=3365709 RepID=UPI0037D35C11